jgi:2'-5' RNA ligase
VAQPDYRDGSMLALSRPRSWPAGSPSPVASRGDLHPTVAYTGKAADVDGDSLRKAAQKAASTVGSITATIGGHARLPQAESDVIVALVDSPDLDRLRCAIEEAFVGQGLGVASEHGFLPHVTLAAYYTAR